MVTKLGPTYPINLWGLILAKIHMVTKLKEKYYLALMKSYSSKNPYGNKTKSTFLFVFI